MGTLWQAQVSAAQLVRVGAAHFPPYTVRPEQGADSGLLPQLLEALNRAQREYQFVLVPTSIPRRFRDFQQGRIDMAIFENPQWGWQDIPHASVDMGLEDAEIFVAQRQTDRGRGEGRVRDLVGLLPEPVVTAPLRATIEPHGSDGPAVRVLLNDHPIYEPVQFAGREDGRMHQYTDQTMHVDMATITDTGLVD